MTRKISRAASILFALAATAACAAAQTGTTTTRQADAPGRTDDAPQDAQSARRASADEDFELNIAERHIVEESFEASTEVAVGGGESRGVNLRVGVAAGAERIDVWLRGVRGRVRFRASLEQIMQRLNSRRAAAAAESR